MYGKNIIQSDKIFPPSIVLLRWEPMKRFGWIPYPHKLISMTWGKNERGLREKKFDWIELFFPNKIRKIVAFMWVDIQSHFPSIEQPNGHWKN